MHGLASAQGSNIPWRVSKSALSHYEHYEETVDVLLTGMLISHLKGGGSLVWVCTQMKGSSENAEELRRLTL